jgi:hypothetical protein
MADLICKRCGNSFIGRYNRSKCDSCKAQVKKQAFDKFKRENPSYWKEWQTTDKRRATNYRQYGITEADVDAMRSVQDFCCLICGAREGSWKANSSRLVVDHNHTTGEVRGMLCPSCNRGLGQFNDDPDTLRAAVQYLAGEL